MLLDRRQPDLFNSSAGTGSADFAADAFCASTSAEFRRSQGITFTPAWLVEHMLQRVAAMDTFDTIVDVGAGTGRFAIAAAQRFPKVHVVAVELNEGLASLLRKKLREAGLSSRVTVIAADYRSVDLPLRGRALFIGNPPYVRHHDIDETWKHWYSQGMAAFGIKASQLAGLHAHFLLRSLQAMRAGDALCFVTAAEWMDNGYGSALRELLTAARAGSLRALWLAATDEPVFPDALVSALVIEAVVGPASGEVTLGRLIGRDFSLTRRIGSPRLRASPRWSTLCQPGNIVPADGIELGELYRVTRGQVTGMNDAWVLPADAPDAMRELGVPAVTRAREIIDGTVTSPQARQRLRYVVEPAGRTRPAWRSPTGNRESTHRTRPTARSRPQLCGSATQGLVRGGHARTAGRVRQLHGPQAPGVPRQPRA